MEKRSPLSTEAVLAKAFELAKANGTDSITYNGLARELGIKPQSMYRYVPDVRTLRTALLSSFYDELIAALSARSSGLAPKDALRAFAVGMYDECHTHPWYYETFELMHRYDLVSELREPLMRLAQLVQLPMEELKGKGPEAARLTQLFVAINLGYAQMSMTQFIPQSLADSREMFIRSIDGSLETL